MKYLAVTMLLAAMQASPTAPQKAAVEPPSSSVVGPNAADKQPATKPAPSGETTAPEPSVPASSNEQPRNSQRSIKVAELPPVSIRTGWRENLSLIFAGALVGIGVYGVLMAKRTLRAIERQAKANEEQLTEIQQSAEKTDRTILLAAQEVENGKIATEAATKSADAAKASADAALLNARAIINSERPWMIIELTPIPGVPRQGYISFRAWNRGRTPAEVTNYQGDFFFHGIDEDFPAEPKFKPWERLYREYISPGNSIFIYGFDLSGSMPPDQWQWMQKEKKYLYCKGRIVYRDLITYEEHESRFCYWLSPADGVGLIMGGDRNWNKYT